MPQSAALNNHTTRGRTSASNSDLIYNVRKQGQRLHPEGSTPRGLVGNPQRTPHGSNGTRRSPKTGRYSETHALMSRSATNHYSASTTASRSHQQIPVTSSRSLSRSHEERSPRIGRRGQQAASSASHLPPKNGLNRHLHQSTTLHQPTALHHVAPQPQVHPSNAPHHLHQSAQYHSQSSSLHQGSQNVANARQIQPGIALSNSYPSQSKNALAASITYQVCLEMLKTSIIYFVMLQNPS